MLLLRGGGGHTFIQPVSYKRFLQWKNFLLLIVHFLSKKILGWPKAKHVLYKKFMIVITIAMGDVQTAKTRNESVAWLSTNNPFSLIYSVRFLDFLLCRICRCCMRYRGMPILRPYLWFITLGRKLYFLE